MKVAICHNMASASKIGHIEAAVSNDAESHAFRIFPETLLARLGTVCWAVAMPQNVDFRTRYR